MIINIINLLKSISYTNFKNISENYEIEKPKFKYYNIEDKDILEKNNCIFFYHHNELESDYIKDIIKKSDIIFCLTNNEAKDKEYIEELNKKCIVELSRNPELIGFLLTLKILSIQQIKYIYVHY